MRADHQQVAVFALRGFQNRFGGMPFEDVYKQMKLFADKVMPHLKG